MSEIMDFVVRHAVKEEARLISGPLCLATLTCTFKREKYFEYCLYEITHLDKLEDIDDRLYNFNLHRIADRITADEQDRETESYIDSLERETQ